MELLSKNTAALTADVELRTDTPILISPLPGPLRKLQQLLQEQWICCFSRDTITWILVSHTSQGWKVTVLVRKEQ